VWSKVSSPNVVIKGGDHLQNIETERYCIVDGIIVVKKKAIISSGTSGGVIQNDGNLDGLLVTPSST
jgi:hypothetical protein